jgi:hypothetical protein
MVPAVSSNGDLYAVPVANMNTVPAGRHGGFEPGSIAQGHFPIFDPYARKPACTVLDHRLLIWKESEGDGTMSTVDRRVGRLGRINRQIWRTPVLLVILVPVIAWIAVPAWTQDKEQDQARSVGGKTKRLGDAKPSRKSAAQWRVEGFNRVVHIHQADATDLGAKALYFYRPLLALEENPTPLAGYPPIVLKAKHQTDGAVKLTFAARLGLPAFDAVAKFQIGQQDAESLRAQQIRPEQVKIEPWPISHAIIDCKLEGESEPLASGQTESLSSIDEQIQFSLTLTAQTLDKFKKGFADKELLFAFSYTFEGRKVAEGSAVSKAVKDIRTVVDQAIRSHLTPGQQKGTAPIFQQHLNTIERDVRVRLNRVIRAQHKDLFPVLTDSSSSAIGKLFELNKEYTTDELQGDKTLSDTVALYLRPLVQTWATSDARSTKLSKEDEDKLTAVRNNKANFGLGLKIEGVIDANVGGGVESTTTTERRNLLKSEYGMDMKKDATGQFYVPYSIKVFKYNNGKQITDIEDVQVAFLAVGEAAQYLQETPVPAHFTVDKLKYLVAKVGEKPRTFADTFEGALNVAIKDLDTVKEHFEKTKKSSTLAAAEQTAAENTLASARSELAAASSKVPGLRKQRDDQVAVVRGMPEEVPAVRGPVRGSLGGGAPKIPKKPNPDLPAAKQKLDELNTALDQAVAAEAAAMVKVDLGTTAAATARAAAEVAQRQLDSAQAKLTQVTAKVEVLRELQKTPPGP